MSKLINFDISQKELRYLFKCRFETDLNIFQDFVKRNDAKWNDVDVYGRNIWHYYFLNQGDYKLGAGNCISNLQDRIANNIFKRDNYDKFPIEYGNTKSLMEAICNFGRFFFEDHMVSSIQANVNVCSPYIKMIIDNALEDMDIHPNTGNSLLHKFIEFFSLCPKYTVSYSLQKKVIECLIKNSLDITLLNYNGKQAFDLTTEPLFHSLLYDKFISDIAEGKKPESIYPYLKFGLELIDKSPLLIELIDNERKIVEKYYNRWSDFSFEKDKINGFLAKLKAQGAYYPYLELWFEPSEKKFNLLKLLQKHSYNFCEQKDEFDGNNILQIILKSLIKHGDEWIKNESHYINLIFEIVKSCKDHLDLPNYEGDTVRNQLSYLITKYSALSWLDILTSKMNYEAIDIESHYIIQADNLNFQVALDSFKKLEQDMAIEEEKSKLHHHTQFKKIHKILYFLNPKKRFEDLKIFLSNVKELHKEPSNSCSEMQDYLSYRELIAVLLKKITAINSITTDSVYNLAMKPKEDQKKDIDIENLLKIFRIDKYIAELYQDDFNEKNFESDTKIAPKTYETLYHSIQNKKVNGQDASSDIEQLKEVCNDNDFHGEMTLAFCNNPSNYDFSQQWVFV